MSYVDKVKVGNTTYDIQDAGAVRAVTGKGLSTNDFTDSEKTKLAGVEAGAQVNVDPEWSDIKHKPTTIAGFGITNAYTKDEVDTALDGKANKATTLAGYGITNAYTKDAVDSKLSDKVDKVSGKGLSTNDFTNAEKTKLAALNTQINFSDLHNTPQTLTGYGITDAYTKTQTDALLDNKANKSTKVNGHALSSNVTLNAEDIGYSGDDQLHEPGSVADALARKANPASTLAGYGITDAYTNSEVDAALAGKVDKVSGKGLSTNDFTDAEKAKLAGIEAGAQANVAPYWSDVQDKPTTIAGYGLTDDLNTALAGKVDVVSGKGLSTNDYTDADKLKLQATNVMYCTCNTSGDEAEKEITIVSPAGAELNYRDTAILCIKFSETNTSERTYFNINGTHYNVVVYGKIVQGGNRDYYGFANVPLLYMLYNGTIHYICGLEDIDTDTDTDTYTSAICDTPGDAQTKRAKCTDYVLRDGNYLHIIMKNDNTAQGRLFLTVGDTAPGMIFINDVRSSDTNYTLPAGSYIIYYNNYNYYFRTDGKIPNITAVPTDAYTKGETDALLEYKADKATTYTKSEIDTKLANIEGATPEWDDVQHKPTTIAGFGITDAYTKGEVDAAIAGNTPDWGDIQNKPTTVAGYGLTDAYTNGQVDTALSGKVDKVSGKGLSTNDYTTAEKTKLAGIEAGAQANVDPDWADVQNKPTTLSGYGIANAYTKGEVDTALAGKAAVATTLAGYGITDAYTRSEVNAALAGKVDAVNGKGLSTEDFTTAEKTKLAELSNVSDWNDIQNKPTTIAGFGITDAYTKGEVDAAIAGVDVGDPDWSDVQNKPTTVAGFGITDAYTKSETDAALSGKVDAVSGKGLSTNDYTDAEKAKLAGLTSTPDFSDIQNTPTTLAGYGITNAYTKGEVDTALAGKVDTVIGKGLSTNDYTDAEKAKVAAMPGISISGDMLVITTQA